MRDFGRLLHESWLLKRSLTDRISNCEIDDIYEAARKAGAIGGKLLGAGGGGFMIFFVEPDKQDWVKGALYGFLQVPFRFENAGSEIIFHHTAYDALSSMAGAELPSVGYDEPETEPARPEIEVIEAKRQYDSKVPSSP